MAKAATLQELETHWSLVDLHNCLLALDWIDAQSAHHAKGK
jgi:hypothetical protein